MPVDARVGLLALGAGLLLAAIAATALKLLPRSVRLLMALFGLGLLAWAMALQVMAPQQVGASTANQAAANGSVPSASNASGSAAASNVTVAPAPANTAAASASAAAPSAPPPARADLTMIASAAFSDCARPDDPGSPPDGAHASRAQMLAAHQAMQAYDAGIAAYTKCIDAAAAHIVAEYRGSVSVYELHAVNDMDVKVHNSAVDQETEIVNRFNQQLRIFLARPGPDQSPLPAAP